jgi:hypothetical protein
MTKASFRMGAAVVVVGWALAGCGGPLTYAVHGSPKAPEIDATIVADVKKDADMTTLKISIEHLAPPSRLGEGKTFVVWSKGEKGKWRRVGGLKYDEGDRKGSLEGASVPVTAFDLQITVEKDAEADAPSGDVLFSQRVN